MSRKTDKRKMYFLTTVKDAKKTCQYIQMVYISKFDIEKNVNTMLKDSNDEISYSPLFVVKSNGEIVRRW